jgi:hypothetical protein
VRAAAPYFRATACSLLRALHSNSNIDLTQFPGDMLPASRIFRAAAILLRNLHSCAGMR